MTSTIISPVVAAMASALDGEGTRVLADFIDERTLLHMPGASGLAGDYQGWDAIYGLIEHMASACAGTLRFETVCTTASGASWVRLCGRVRGARFGRWLATAATLEASIGGSVIREAWLSCADQPTWDDFWR
jgi:hypothetical protein